MFSSDLKGCRLDRHIVAWTFVKLRMWSSCRTWIWHLRQFKCKVWRYVPFMRSRIETNISQLIRRRRIFGRTAVHTVPDIFLFMPLVSSSRKVNRLSRLNKHLNDHIMMHHLHNDEDGFPYLERTRASSSVHTPSLRSSTAHAMSSSSTIKRLQSLADSVFVGPEVRRYIAGIPVFLRLQAAVFTGISPRATSHLILLSKALAVIHRLTYVTPSLVDLATQKIYPHRISIAAPQQERSLQYGSALDAIKSTLKDATPQTIIFKTLDNLEQPP